jgi:hypothetical protein
VSRERSPITTPALDRDAVVDRGGAVGDQPEQRGADAHQRAVGGGALALDLATVDERAVVAAQVADPPAIAGPPHLGVDPRRAAVVELELAGGGGQLAPERGLAGAVGRHHPHQRLAAAGDQQHHRAHRRPAHHRRGVGQRLAHGASLLQRRPWCRHGVSAAAARWPRARAVARSRWHAA